jgi:hypothetical protein
MWAGVAKEGWPWRRDGIIAHLLYAFYTTIGFSNCSAAAPVLATAHISIVFTALAAVRVPMHHTYSRTIRTFTWDTITIVARSTGIAPFGGNTGESGILVFAFTPNRDSIYERRIQHPSNPCHTCGAAYVIIFSWLSVQSNM